MVLFKKFEISLPAKVANPAKDATPLAVLSTLATVTKKPDSFEISGIAALANSCLDYYGFSTLAAPEKKQCYWCKSTDFWVGGTVQNPNYICRRCHPPAPRAEVSHAPTEQ